MSRKVLGLFCLLAILFVSYASAQAPLPMQIGSLPGGGCSSLFPSMSAKTCEWAGVELIPSVNGGMQWTAMNFDLPIIAGPAGIRPVELSLQDANLWVGSIRIDARRDTLAAFVSAEGNLRRSVTVSMPVDPFLAGASSVEWTGSEIEWWSFDGGLAFSPVYNIAIGVGFRYDHLTLGLADPRAANGLLPPPVPFFDYRGDILTKLWVPYLAFIISGPNYRATLSGSPFAWAEVRLPVRLTAIPSPGIADFNDLNYKLNKPGGFLEADVAYWVGAGSPAHFGLWARGTWLQVRGKGSEDFQEVGTLVLENESASETGTLSRYTLSAGVSALLVF